MVSLFLLQEAGFAAGITIGVGATVTMAGAPTITTNGDWDNNGTFTKGSGTVVLNGTTSTTFEAGGSSFNNLTVNKTAAADADDNVTVQTDNLAVTATTTITDGELIQGATNLTLAGITVAAAGKYSNASTGDLTLSSDVANAGSIVFNSSDDAGNGIVIASSDGATQRNWQGAGTFSMTDVTASYQKAVGGTPAFIFVSSGTDSLNNTNWIFGGGSLTALNVEPASLVAGAEGDVTVTFTLAALLPVDGKVVIDLPSGFDATGLAAITNLSGTDGGWTIALSNGNGTNDIVTLTRDGTGTLTAASTVVSLRLEDQVRNPQVSGSTGTYAVETQTAASATINTGTASADTITGGALSATNVEPASLIKGAVGNVVVSFTTANPVPLDGKIVVTFPTSLGSGFTFDSGGATAVGASAGFDGALAVSIAANVVTITRSGGTASAAGIKSITLSNIKNPTAAGSTGTYSIATTTSAAVGIDSDGAVAADTITIAASASVPLFLDSTGAVAANYVLGSGTTGKLYLRVTDTDENSNDATVQTVAAVVTSARTGDSETITLTETGAATGIFASAAAGIVYDADDAASVGNGQVETRGGDTLTLTYTDDDDGTDVTTVTAGVQADEGQILMSLDVQPRVVQIGDVLTFTVIFTNKTTQALSGFSLVTQLPTGVSYLTGSANASEGTFVDSGGTSPVSFTQISDLTAGQSRTFLFQGVLGSAAQNGDLVASIYAQVNPIISNTAQVTILVRPDPIFTVGTLIGKVFEDLNRDGRQNEGERGVPNAVLATEQGTVITTDAYGRYSVPDFLSGRHMVKIDRASLPEGSELTTPEAVIINQTDAMLNKVNFGVVLPAGASEAFNAEREGGIRIMVEKDLTSLKKRFDLSFYTVKENSFFGRTDLSRPEETVDPATTITSASEPVLPFRLDVNYARFVEKWSLEIVRLDVTADKIFDRVEDPYQLKAVATAEGRPELAELRFPWKLPRTDADGKAIGYGVRIRLHGAKGLSDAALYRIESWPHTEGLQWKLTQMDAKDAIPVSGGAVRLSGQTHANTQLVIDGRSQITDREGKFSHEVILPSGKHTLPILFFRDGPTAEPLRLSRTVDLSDTQLFFVGFTEYEYGQLDIKGNIQSVTTEDKARFSDSWYDEGRVAYYLKGKVKGKYLITASVDTQREKRDLFRNLEPEDFYPVYGDQSSVRADANDTQDRYYLLVEADKSYFKYGNFDTGLTGTEFADFSRTLHGAKAHYESLAQSADGQSRTVVTVFQAMARQKAARGEFAATGGSLYYLKHQDIVQGSEKVKAIARDRVTGLVLSETPMVEGVDYSMDYDMGRVRLYRPISSFTFESDTILSSEALTGHPQFLAVDYEYRVEDDQLKDRTTGARASQAVLDDAVRVGGTYVQEDRNFERFALTGVDGAVFLPRQTTLRGEVAKSTLQSSGVFVSSDGGLTFDQAIQGQEGVISDAYKLEVETSPWTGAQVQAFYRTLDPNFSSAETAAEAGLERYGLAISQDLGVWGTLTALHQNEKVNEASSTATQEFPRAGREIFNVRHKHNHGRFDFTEEYRSVDSADLQESLAGAEVGYALDPLTRIAVGGQTDLAVSQRSEARITGERKLGEGLTVVAAQAIGERGPGSMIGLSGSTFAPAGLSSSTGQGPWNKTFGNYVPDPNPVGGPQSELGLRKEFAAGTTAQVGQGVGGESGGVQTFKLNRATDDGRVLEFVQQVGGTQDVSSFTQTTPVGPNAEKYSQSATTTDRVTGLKSETQAEGLRARSADGRLTMFQEDTSTRAASGERQGRRLGAGLPVGEHTTVEVAYERDQERLTDGLRRDHHAGDLAIHYYEFERLKLDNAWQFRREDDVQDTDQLLSAGSAMVQPDTDWTLFTRYDWSWTKNAALGLDLARFTEIHTGFAYRPVANDRWNVLTEYKWLADDPPAGQLDIDNVVSGWSRVVRGEFAYEFAPRWTFTEKLAARDRIQTLMRQDPTESRTYLSAHRLAYQLTDRWDVAGEMRWLGQTLAQDHTTSFVAETSYRVIDAFRVTVGYSGSDYETKLARDMNVETRGMYVRLFYDVLEQAKSVMEKKNGRAQDVAERLEKELATVQTMNVSGRDLQEMKSRLEYARTLMDKRLYDEAVDHLNAGLELATTARKEEDKISKRRGQFDFYVSQGKLFAENGMHARAFAEFDKAYRIDSFDPDLLELMAKTRGELERLKIVKRGIRSDSRKELKRIRTIKDASAAVETTVRLHLGAGKRYLQAGLVDEAIEEWSRGLELVQKMDPESKEAALTKGLGEARERAQAALDAGDPAAAAKELSDALEKLKNEI